MKKFTLALTVAALAIGGTAAGVVYAQQDGAMGGGHKSGMHGMMADPFGDATITRADAQAKAAAMFDKMDLNHDGKLDAADRAIRIGEHFDKMDANHDGVLSKQEFIAAHEQAMAAHEGHEGMKRPGHEGPGHDGPGMKGPEMMGHGMMEHGMMGMDANGDRTVTRDEFVAGALKRFDAADANHDGKLTKEERLAAFRAHMRERREGMHGGMGHPGADGPMGDGGPMADGPMGGHD